MEKIHVYTDGANQVHKSKAGGWGAVILQGKQQIEIYGGERNTTNNRMEIVACIQALKAIQMCDFPIFIYSDSQYVVNTMQSKWYEKWKENGWRTAKRSVKNKDLWEQLIHEVENKKSVTFIKIKGHSGHIFNELADDLANRGLESVLNERKNKYDSNEL